MSIARDLPDFVLSRDGKLKGEVIGTRRCQLGGCTGVAFVVRWPDGKRTHPCGKGTGPTDDPKVVRIKA